MTVEHAQRIVLQAALLAGLIAAVMLGDLHVGSAVIVGLFAIMTVEFAFRLLRVLHDDPPRVESHWGGLGGTVGGWHVSVSLVYLVATLIFGTLTAVAANAALTPKTGQPSGATPDAPSDSAARDTSRTTPGPGDSTS